MTVVNEYDIGDLVRVEAVFSLDDVNTDPSVVKLTIVNPASETWIYYDTSPEMMHTASGMYHLEFIPSGHGAWYARWEGYGTVQAAGEETIYVKRSNVLRTS
jgi:hypothetical protein